MTAMSIRLGPALKICSAVDAMREQLKQVGDLNLSIVKSFHNKVKCFFLCVELT